MLIQRCFYLLASVALACCPALPGVAGPAAEPAYKQGAYRGGALLVTDPKRAQGHLRPGQVLDIRLSRLVPQGTGLPALTGTETAGSVRYGQLVFQEVSPAGVTFSVAFRTDGDALGPARTLTLHPGDSADLTGDGLPDLMVQAPVKALTAGAAAIDYVLLAFPCDAAHSAMFALAPEAFKGARYPYGISGVTPKGHFIFQSDCLPLRPAGPSNPDRAAFFYAGAPLAVEPTPGDVMVEAHTGCYGRIEQVHRDPGGLDIHYAAARTPFLFQEVFGAAYIHISGRLPELVRRYRGGTARTLVDLDLVDFDISQNLIDNDSGRLDLQAAAHLDASLTLSANINYYGVSAAVDAEVDESLRLAALYRAGQPWELSFGPWTLASPRVGLPVCGVPIAFCLPVTVGISVDSSYTGSLVEGVQSSGSWGWSAQMAATWGWSGVEVNAPAPVSRNSLVSQGLPENSVHMDGKASIRPWLAISPKLEIAHLLNGGCENTLLVVGSIQGESAAGSSDRAQLDAGYELKAVCSVDVPLLGKVWERKWPLYDASRTVWSRTWSVTPSAAKAP